MGGLRAPRPRPGGTPRKWSRLQRLQYYDLLTPLADKLLVKVDRSLMVWGVEARVPYPDHRIVEFGPGLPDALKVRGRIGKVFLRNWVWRSTATTPSARGSMSKASRGLIEAQQHSDGYSEQVWGLMQFAIWHRIFVEQPGGLPGRNEDLLDWIR